MSTEIINKALYSFPVKDDCTITPIVKPIPSFQTLEWPLSMHTDIDGKNTYLFQKSYDIIFPTWCEYVKVEMPIIKKNGVDAPLSTISITSDSNVVWFDNTTETNKLVKNADLAQTNQNIEINFNGTYGFNNKKDIDYFMSEAQKMVNRRLSI